MHIQAEDIETLIFDFHEGNLSASEKSELLNFIHLHPEYEKDFALWAQSYMPINNIVNEYDLTKNLLHESTRPWYKRPLIYIGATLLLTSFLSLSVAVFYDTPHKPNELVNSMPIQTISPAHLVPEQVVSKYQNIKTPITPIIKKPSHPTSIDQIKKSPNIITIKDTVEITKTTSNINIEKDSLFNKSIVIDNTEVHTTKKTTSSKKRKSNFVIPPSGSFIPTNPDF